MKKCLYLLLILSLFPLSVYAAPVILGASAVAADNDNWPGDSSRGAAITIYGSGFGSSRGSSTLTCCGVTLNSDSQFAEWGANTSPNLPSHIRRITFWTTLDMSGSGGISITVGGEQSTYRGVDSNSTTIAPFQIVDAGTITRFPEDHVGQTLEQAAEAMDDADFMYIQEGSYNSSDVEIGNDYFGEWLIGHSLLRRTIAAYPGQDVNFTHGNGFSIMGNFWTIANIRFDIKDSNVIRIGHQACYSLRHNLNFSPDENFTGYVHTDTTGRLSVASDAITVSTLDNDEDAYVVGEYKSGVDFWESHFQVNARFSFSTLSSDGAFVWAMTKSNDDDIQGLIDANEDLLAAKVYEDSGSYYFVLLESNEGSINSSSPQPINLNQTYFVSIRRDEEAHSRNPEFGYLIAYLYTTSDHDDLDINESDMVAQDAIDILLTEKQDFRYWYPFSSANTGRGGSSTSGLIGVSEHRVGIPMGNWALGLEGYGGLCETNSCHFLDSQGHNNRIAFTNVNYQAGTGRYGSTSSYNFYARAGASYWLAYNELSGGSCWNIHLFDETRDYEDVVRRYDDCAIEGSIFHATTDSTPNEINTNNHADGAVIIQATNEARNRRTIVKNNIFLSKNDSLSHLLRVRHDVSSIRIVNNLFVGSSGGSEDGIMFSAGQGLGITADEVSNNIFFQLPGFDIIREAGTLSTISNNGYDTTPHHEDVLVELNAQTNLAFNFTNESIGNYSPQPNSENIDQGKALSYVAADIWGGSRPQNGLWDIGPYEYGSQILPTGTPPTISGVEDQVVDVGAPFTYDLSVYVIELDGDDITYALDSGSDPLPAGLTLNANGTISGTAIEVCTRNIAIRVTDRDGQASQDYTDSFTLTVVEESNIGGGGGGGCFASML